MAIYGGFIVREHFDRNGRRQFFNEDELWTRESGSEGRILVEAPNAKAAERLIKGVYLLNEAAYTPRRTSRRHPQDRIKVVDLLEGGKLAEATGFSMAELSTLVSDEVQDRVYGAYIARVDFKKGKRGKVIPACCSQYIVVSAPSRKAAKELIGELYLANEGVYTPSRTSKKFPKDSIAMCLQEGTALARATGFHLVTLETMLAD